MEGYAERNYGGSLARCELSNFKGSGEWRRSPPLLSRDCPVPRRIVQRTGRNFENLDLSRV